jgi:Domain of unknown function (DUF4260)
VRIFCIQLAIPFIPSSMGTVSSALPQTTAGEPARPGSVAVLLRLEGFAVAILTASLYAHTGASWWLFAALWILPDLSMLGYLISPCRGASLYNTFHTYLLPAVLALFGFWLRPQGLLEPIALIWVNHIGIDRALGYGLKYSQGFAFTHLGRIGQKAG